MYDLLMGASLQRVTESDYPAGNYMFKVNNKKKKV